MTTNTSDRSGFPRPLDTLGPSDVLVRNWWAFAVRGAIAILLGIIAFAAPGVVLLTLALFFAAYLIVDGIFGIVSGVKAAQAHERWGWLIGEGVINLILGIAIFVFPGSAVLASVWLLAIWAIVTGALMLGAAFKVHPDYGRWWLGLGGIVSIIWGILLLLWPFVGAVVLTWWLGAYAIIFGVLLLIFAFRLRGRATAAPART